MRDLRLKPKKEVIEIQKALQRSQAGLSQAVSQFTSSLTGKAASTNPAGFQEVIVTGTATNPDTVTIGGNRAIVAGCSTSNFRWQVTGNTLEVYDLGAGQEVTFLVFDA